MRRHPFAKHPRNRCIDASVTFLELLKIKRNRHLFLWSGTVNGEEHHWVIINNTSFDFTARQYDPALPCPLVWHGARVEHPLGDPEE